MSEVSADATMQASLSALVLSIGSSAAMALGQAPNPMTGQTQVDKKLAKFNIDLLGVIENKTKGNLSADEEKLIKSLLHDLQLKFVNV